MRGRRRTPALVVAIATTFGIVVATPTAAHAVTCDGVTAAEHEYTVPFGQTLKIPEPGLLADGDGSRLLQVSWGTDPDANPDPYDDDSYFGNATIEYRNHNGALSRT